jgi:hypothetical protein
MSEKEILTDLYLHYGRVRGGKKARLMADCVFLFAWESDFVILNSSEYYVEFEVKLNKYDFRSDFKKLGRHKCLSAEIDCSRPNKFYYVCPAGVIEPHEVPNYAGLMYYFPEKKGIPNRFMEIKPAPFLHREKLNLFKELSVKLMYKYLNLRKKCQI